jgi:hypothetical protein
MSDSTTPRPLIEWCMEHGKLFGWRAYLDNHFPAPRDTAQGVAYSYTKFDSYHEGDDPRIVIFGAEVFKHMEKANFLVDDRRTVRPYYVSGYSPPDFESRHVILSPFPTNFHRDGSPVLRPDGTPVNMANWQVGPRVTYHLIVTEGEL